MTADIEAIRKRHATLDADKRAPAEVETAELCVNLSYAHADRAALLATLDAMTAQVTREKWLAIAKQHVYAEPPNPEALVDAILSRLQGSPVKNPQAKE